MKWSLFLTVFLFVTFDKSAFGQRKKTMEQVLTSLAVSGMVHPVPEWQLEGSGLVNELVFDFGERVAFEIPTQDIDSKTVRVRLVNAPVYPATVLLSRPSRCRIGSLLIRNEDVHFILNGTPFARDTDLGFASADSQSLVLRFSRHGGYGTAAGSVLCEAPGMLAYSY